MSRFAPLLALSLAVAGAALAGGPETVHLDPAGHLVVPAAMQKAIDAVYPNFKTWSAGDYSARARQSTADMKTAIAPFALLQDLNNDGLPDLVLDGHDDRHSLLIGVVSTPDGYAAKLITMSEPEDPSRIVDYDSGKPDVGFNRFFMAREGREDVFSVGYTQLTGKNGDLLNDGNISDFVFADGEFTESHEPL